MGYITAMAPLADASILRLNPWWRDPAWPAGDPHLRARERQGIDLELQSFSRDLPLGEPAVHIVRGPRQVGKSTAAKDLIARAGEDLDPTRVIYLALDELRDAPIADVTATIRRAKVLATGSERTERCVVVLDEVTVVRGWADAVKALWDEGTLRGDVTLCTGSSAIDLHSDAVERLPGRRGPGRDMLMLPASFSQFARACDRSIPRSPGLTVGTLCATDGRDVLAGAQRHLPALDRQLERYLVFGGLPASVAEAANGAAEPSSATTRVVWDSLSRETARRGASDVALRALLERVAVSLGSKTSWSAVAADMGGIPLGSQRRADRPGPGTVQTYVELLARSYSVMVTYFWKSSLGTSDQSRDKKLFFADPLLYTALRERTPGLAFNVPAAVEAAIGTALYRRYEPEDSQATGMEDPARLHVWQTTRGREIDFVCGPRAAIECVEVKYQARITGHDSVGMRKAFPGRPALLVSRDAFRLADDHVVAPAALVLWALG